MLTLMAVPGGLISQDEIRDQFDDALRRQGLRRGMEGEGREVEFRFRGEPVTVAVSTVVAENGERLSQYFIPIEVDGRNVLIYFLGSDDVLFPEGIQAFLDSAQ